MYGSNLCDLAEKYANEYHRDMKYGDEPYTKHLADVVQVLERFGYAEDSWRAAGWLHDILEDTECSPAWLQKEFGSGVFNLVNAVTTPRSIGNRAARLEFTIRKLQSYPAAIPLKLADRIANVSVCWETQDSRLFMYYKEYPRFRQALIAFHNLNHIPMWAELDKLHGRRHG